MKAKAGQLTSLRCVPRTSEIHDGTSKTNTRPIRICDLILRSSKGAGHRETNFEQSRILIEMRISGVVIHKVRISSLIEALSSPDRFRFILGGVVRVLDGRCHVAFGK